MKTREEIFEIARAECSSEGGKAWLDLAESLLASAAGDVDFVKECRQWVLTALAWDKARQDGDIAGLKKKAERKAQASDVAARAKAAVAAAAAGSTNVRPIRDGI